MTDIIVIKNYLLPGDFKTNSFSLRTISTINLAKA